MLGAVAQAFLLFEHKLRQHQIVGHLHGSHVQPLKNQIVHRVANWRERQGELIQAVRQVQSLSTRPGRRNSQLSSCIVHVWLSIGKFFRSIGQDRVSVSLKTRQRHLFFYFFRKEKRYESLTCREKCKASSHCELETTVSALSHPDVTQTPFLSFFFFSPSLHAP